MDEGQEEDEGRVETEIVISSCLEKKVLENTWYHYYDDTVVIMMIVGDLFMI